MSVAMRVKYDRVMYEPKEEETKPKLCLYISSTLYSFWTNQDFYWEWEKSVVFNCLILYVYNKITKYLERRYLCIT